MVQQIINQETSMNAIEVVDYALTYARQECNKCGLSDYAFGYALGQLMVAECDMRAPAHIVEGARNEIGYLYGRSRQ